MHYTKCGFPPQERFRRRVAPPDRKNTGKSHDLLVFRGGDGEIRTLAPVLSRPTAFRVRTLQPLGYISKLHFECGPFNRLGTSPNLCYIPGPDPPTNSAGGNREEQQDRTDPNSRFELARKPAWLLAFRQFGLPKWKHDFEGYACPIRVGCFHFGSLKQQKF